MKILQFTPLSPPKESKSADKTVQDQNAAGGSFASFLQKAGEAANQPTEAPGNPGRVIFLENMRALNVPSSLDLGRAGKLLGRLEAAIKSTGLETLEKVHNLEGLLYIHNKNTHT